MKQFLARLLGHGESKVESGLDVFGMYVGCDIGIRRRADVGSDHVDSRLESFELFVLVRAHG